MKKIKAILLSSLVAVVAVFCGFCLTACNDDGGENNGENGGEVTAPEKPLSLTTSVKTTADGENTYTINAIVNPSTLTPRWAIVWENPDSEWATGKDTADYLNLELSNGDKTATLSTKQPFGETALLTATISSPTGEVSVSKRVYYDMGLTYELNDDGKSYIVSGFSNLSTVRCSELVIPFTYNDLPIKSIKKEAFSYNTDLEAVYIPDSIEEIGNGAFEHCSSLSKIVLGKNVRSIGFQAFYVTPITSMFIPDSVVFIAQAAFQRCDFLQTVEFENTVGWWYSFSATSEKEGELDFSDPVENAKHLRLWSATPSAGEYSHKYLHRS